MQFSHSTSRFVSPSELASIIEQAKADGRKVVFTNGVFDFVHAGHLEYLEKARSLGDMLVMAINTDSSVQRIKGPTRPINAEDDRAHVLCGLRCVDYVTLFDEDTPTQILDLLKPSIHAKGGDYDPEKMPETPTVRKHGGEVVIIPLKAGYSNSKQFARIKAAIEADEANQFERPAFLAK